MKPFITDDIKKRVIDVLESGYLTEGPVTKEFEHTIQSYLQSQNAIAVTSCTTGLEVALRAYDIGPGDEVIVPDYTYPATASVVNIVGATCVIVDINKKTLLIDYDALEKAITPKTKAIIPVSLFGNPLDYDRLEKIKQTHNVRIIEDAACSIGAQFKGVKVGNHCDISVFSLHPRKFITTGEGGIITAKDKKISDWINSYKHFGMRMDAGPREGYNFDIPGTNYKLSNLLAAIGLGQMAHIEHLLSNRLRLADQYKELFSNLTNITLQEVTRDGLHSYQSFVIFVKNRDHILQTLRSDGIEVQIGTFSLHKHKAFSENPLVQLEGSLSNSSEAFSEVLTLPLYDDMTIEEQTRVRDAVVNLVE